MNNTYSAGSGKYRNGKLPSPAVSISLGTSSTAHATTPFCPMDNCCCKTGPCKEKTKIKALSQAFILYEISIIIAIV
jgi:hypothetical protein